MERGAVASAAEEEGADAVGADLSLRDEDFAVVLLTAAITASSGRRRSGR